MKQAFSNCISIKQLPEISKWNTSNIDDLTGLFEYCISLIKIPDISKWKISNVKNMNYMFYKCNSLLHTPDISNWNLEANILIDNILYNSKSSNFSFSSSSNTDDGGNKLIFKLNSKSSGNDSQKPLFFDSQKDKIIKTYFSLNYFDQKNNEENYLEDFYQSD